MSAPAIALAIPEPADGGAEPLAVRAERRPDRRIVVCAVPRPATGAAARAAADRPPRPDRARRAPGRPDRSGWPGGRAGRLPARRGPAACCRCPAAPSRDPHRGAPVSGVRAGRARRGCGTRRNRQVALRGAPGAAAVLLRAAADGGALSRAYLVDLASGAERRALAWALRDDGDRPLPAARCREAAAALASVTAGERHRGARARGGAAQPGGSAHRRPGRPARR